MLIAYPEPLTEHHKPSQRGISEAGSLSTKLLAQYPVLLSQIVDREPLLPVDPTRRRQDEKL